MSPQIELRHIEFGLAGAEEEGAFHPELLLAGFHDPENLINEALNGRKFLFLGYKGAGKTAIAEHIRLISKRRHDLFVEVISLADFPFSAFRKIVKGDDGDDTKYPTAWSWLLLIRFLEMFRRDNGGYFAEPDVTNKIFKTLEDLALLPNPDFKKTVLTSSKNSFAARLYAVTATHETNSTAQSAADLMFFIDRLRSQACSFSSDSRHLLIIDGLDDILTKKTIQFEALAGLIFESNRMNREFALKGVQAKVIILCRTDLFERVPGPNTNKLRQDAAVHLNWYHDSKEPQNSDLVKLINRRASLSAKMDLDVFVDYFPPEMQRNASKKQQDTRGFLLDLTRHTPRDLIVLMTSMKKFASKGRLTKEEVYKAVAEYSKDYFLPEIKNELSGYVSDEQTKWVLELIGALRKREFTLGDLNRHAETMQSSGDGSLLLNTLTHLFECSAIGNVDITMTGVNYFTFRYRNRQTAFSPTKKIILHYGMWKAFNLV